MSAVLSVGLLDFKADRLVAEFENGIDPRLRAVLFEAAHECSRRGWPRLLVTCLYRTEAEEIAVKAKSRTHHDRRAADLSVRPMVEAGKDPDALVDYLNDAFGAAMQSTAYRHGGTADHLHVQVVKRDNVLVKSRWRVPDVG